MKYWNYKAYDETLIIREGIIQWNGTADEFIVKLRQQGLQVASLSETTMEAFLIEQRLLKYRKRTNQA